MSAEVSTGCVTERQRIRTFPFFPAISPAGQTATMPQACLSFDLPLFAEADANQETLH
jgi:hypothetical protein